MSTHPHRPIWELSAPVAPETAALGSDLETDVLIVGAGFSGLSSALHLQDSGRNVVLIESHSIGWGASGRNGGHVLPLIRKDPKAIVEHCGAGQGDGLIQMIAESADYVFSLIERYGIDCDAERNGWLQAIHSDAQMKVCRDRYQQWLPYGADMELLNAQQSAELMGSFSYKGALFVKSAGHINPLAFCRGMAKELIAQGVRIFTDTPALSMHGSGKRWEVKTPSGTIIADKVVLVTAAYSDDLWPGLKKSFLPFYLYNIATKPLDAELQASVLPGRQPVTDTRSDSHVFHYDAAGRLISGGTFIFPTGWEERIVRHAESVLKEIFPQLQNPQFELDYLWRGKISMTADILPHCHILAPNVYTWLGCNARGIALATRMGAVLADAVNEVDVESWPLRPTAMKPIPAQEFSRLMTSVMLACYRLRDKVM
ncbi:MAG: FAD-dependent oxidoreductase [Gammaproteobacteria bacterium]|nr:FAD-dependent oxidoreductase [Gammaproteobacteria bacterium]